MKLRRVLHDIDHVSAPPTEQLDLEITGLAYDSRQVSPGDVFVAVRGLQHDGNKYIPAALKRGAVAVISGSPPADPAIPWIHVRDDRAALARAAANFFEHPTRQLRVVGVTGTNGKTTTTYLVESITRAAGAPCAVFGTIGYRGPGFDLSAERTTPEAPDLQRLFRKVADAGWTYVAMEISSHAVALGRVLGVHVEVAIFTNLTQDHLDFHQDMESYYLEKKKLFLGLDGVKPKAFVLNRDDERFEDLRAVSPERVLSYGLTESADIFPRSSRFDETGTTATFVTPIGEFELHTSLSGRPNLWNAGAAIGAGIALGFSLDQIGKGLEGLAGVPGRFELIHAGQPFRVIVDYAHTDDALRRVLETSREITSGRLIVVFGCGGDRDKTKRPLMGEAAGALADFVVLTSDNPRNEDPKQIIAEIETGLRRTGTSYAAFVDRHDAIRAALKTARAGDTVLVAGKGHEAYQVVGALEIPFDDRQVIRGLLRESLNG